MLSALRHLAPIPLICAAAACIPSLEDDVVVDVTGDSESDDQTDSQTAGQSDTDPQPDPDTTGDPDPGTATGPDGDALGDSVFLFLHDDDDNTESVHAYDVATDETWVVTDLDVAIRSVAIHPDRTRLAIAAYYESTDPDESEGIWGLPAQGGEPVEIMDAWPGDPGEIQNIADVAYSADGSELYFGHSTSTTGGGVLGRVDAAGGVPEILLDASGTCVGNTAPAPDPTGARLLSVRDGCTDPALEGLVLYDLPVGDAGVVAIPDGELEFAFAPPQWSADGAAVIVLANVGLDLDGDGFVDAHGDALLLWDLPGGQLFEVVPAAEGQVIRGFAVSPDERFIAMCLPSAAGDDLVLADLGGESITYRTLTDDGRSCRVAW